MNPAEKLREIEKIRGWALLATHGEETAVRGLSDMLIGTLRRSGYCLSPELDGSLQERQLLIAYAAAYRDALDVLEGEYSGKASVSRHASAPLLRAAKVSAPIAPTMQLSTAVKEFLQTLAPGKRAMNEKHAFILPAFLEVVGDMPITELRQGHVNDFLRTVQKLPPRWSDLRRKNGQTIREIANEAWPETLSLNTYEGAYIASLRSFLERAKRDWQDIGFPTTLSASVPYVGTRTKVERKQRAIRPEEMRQIFFSEAMEKIIKTPTKAHKFWLLAIELYTGARVREICQLNPQHDWGCRDGIWWLRFTDEVGELPAPDVIKSVKTGKSRTISMHAELVRIGLPEYLERLKHGGARRLFPQWSSTNGDAGAAPGKWVANYLRSIGLHGVSNEKGNAVRGSHAFRHTLLTYGRKSRVNLRCISGHADESDNPVADGYEDETLLLSLDVKADRLAKLYYAIELPTPVPVLIPSTARQSRSGHHHQRSKLGDGGT
ncbi:integrase [Acidovorax sp. SRB_14]|uniref:integrase n=1 Tax=Acidovorax sp. SRB_14 TaxID=1962699 RepID=UPI0020B12917|nr:integrase [Acidovorax sp. SRB_14]